MAEFNPQQYWHHRLGASDHHLSPPAKMPTLDHHHFPISLDHSFQQYYQQGSASVDAADQHIASSSSSPTPNEKPGSVRRSNRKKISEKGEVVHVRARRGQATDSHSVAERVRREKINNKLRCLQELVPGCHKSMGMAVMLEEIINYVYSLQNQVEFLSMELAASASANGYLHNMNLEPQPPIIRSKAQPQANNLAEVKSGEEYGDASYFQSPTTTATTTTTTWSI